MSKVQFVETYPQRHCRCIADLGKSKRNIKIHFHSIPQRPFVQSSTLLLPACDQQFCDDVCTHADFGKSEATYLTGSLSNAAVAAAYV
jgi:hypothetical protein